MINEEFLWVEKYRPKTIEETILPVDLKKTFQQFVDQKNIPNLILAGSAGVGKTTVARAMLEQLGCDYIIINSSMNRGIDVLRTDITDFASTMSFSGGRKYVILDEADYLGNNTQPALRNFMEEFSANCGFILTCNFKNKIIDPLHSRCSVIDFKISKKDMAKLAGQFFKRVQTILDTENVKYDVAVVAEVIKKYFPDWRRVINELQRYSATGAIDSGILANIEGASIKELVNLLKDKSNYSEVRKWVYNNSDQDQHTMFRSFYDHSTEFFHDRYIPMLIMSIAEYQYKAAFAVDAEINLMAFLTDVMVNGDFK
jgi:DNA polymerase III delta prime subunit